MLLTWLNGPPPQNIAAQGYIVGVFDASYTVVHCAPAAILPSQVVAAVQKTLQEDATHGPASADRAVTSTLERLWPCEPKKQPGRTI